MPNAVRDCSQGAPQMITAALLLNHVADIVNGEWRVHGCLVANIEQSGNILLNILTRWMLLTESELSGSDGSLY